MEKLPTAAEVEAAYEAGKGRVVQVRDQGGNTVLVLGVDIAEFPKPESAAHQPGWVVLMHELRASHGLHVDADDIIGKLDKQLDHARKFDAARRPKPVETEPMLAELDAAGDGLSKRATERIRRLENNIANIFETRARKSGNGFAR